MEPVTFPGLADIDAIGRDADAIRRNLRITQAYHELSLALARRLGAGANWCTFATWASRQAGQTIRREDLARAIEADLGGAEEIGDAVTRVSEFLRVIGRSADRSRIVAAIREAFSPVRAVERASEAVARGNKKVFDELGREFSRFVATLAGRPAADTAAIERFSAELRPGPPPDGQDLLRAAFTSYGLAMAAGDARSRAELILLANLRIGLHEQTRLQPEIADALNAPLAGPREIRERLIRRLVPQGDSLLAGRRPPGVGLTSPLDEIVGGLGDRLRRRIRAVITECFMTLDLPGGRLRLGRDVAGVSAAMLREPTTPELVELLATVDPEAGSALGSGAEDWADLSQRMHFIAELFRSRQEDDSLFDPPFTAPQTEAIRQGGS
jgi:hypothetical protein